MSFAAQRAIVVKGWGGCREAIGGGVAIKGYPFIMSTSKSGFLTLPVYLTLNSFPFVNINMQST